MNEMRKTKSRCCAKLDAQITNLRFISEASTRRLKRSALTLCFIASFMLLIAITAKNAGSGRVLEAGAFDSGFALYALCYDCSNADAVEGLMIDLEQLKQRGIELVLPHEIRSISSDSALIFLKNAFHFDLLSEMLENGLRSAVIIEEDCIEKVSHLKSFINKNKAEAVYCISNSAKHAAPSLIEEIFDSKLEIMSRFGIEIDAFIFDCSVCDLESFSVDTSMNDMMLFEYGVGVNRIKSEWSELGVISIVNRGLRIPFLTCLEDGGSN